MSAVIAAAVSLTLGAALSLFLRGNSLRAWVAVLSQALATLLIEVAVLPVLFGGRELIKDVTLPLPVGELRLHVDALSAFFLAWSLPLTLLGSIYALGYLAPYFGKQRHVGLHWALLNTTSLSFVLVYTLENGLAFFFGWELAALSAWLLVIWDYSNQKIRFAGFNYLVSTHLGLMFLVAAFMLMRGRTGSFEFEAFSRFLHEPSGARDVVFVLLVVSFGLKSAFFPFHTWLPRAHAAAPAHVSALMSGVIHKAGLFGLLKLALLMGRPEEWMGWFVLAFSAGSAVAGVLYTTTQRDLKRLLGYSSTENVGICGMGIGVGLLGLAWDRPALAALGFAGGVLHILNHALFKCLLFYGAGAVYRATHTVDLERLGGLVKVMPRTTLLVLVGALASCALPPFNGFVSELCLYASLLSGLAPTVEDRALFVLVSATLAFVGAVSALAMARAFGVAFLGTPRDATCAARGDVAPSLHLAMVACALGVVVLGAWPRAGLALVQGPTRLLLGALPPDGGALAGPAAVVAPIGTVGLALLAVIGALWGVRRLALEHGSTLHVTWGCGYGAPTARMQYTAASFSDQLRRLFLGIMPLLRREALPRRDEPFPGAGHHLHTHSVDAIERRMFEVIGRGQATANAVNEAIPEEPRASFALGLVFLIVAGALVLRGVP